MLLSNMLTTLRYSLANIARIISLMNMKISVPGFSENRLAINTDKTKETVFHQPASRHHSILLPLPDMEQVSQATLLGIDMTSAYVNRMLMQINQQLYFLLQLKSQGMNVQALHTLPTGLFVSNIAYILPVFAVQLMVDDRNRIDAISQKALHV